MDNTEEYYNFNEVYTVIVPKEKGPQDIIVRLGCDDKYDPAAWTLLGAYGDTSGEWIDITVEDYCQAIELVQTIHRRLI